MAAGDVLAMHGFESGDSTKDGLTIVTTGGTVTETATNKQTGDYCLRVNRTSNASVYARWRTDTPSTSPFPTGKRAVGICFSLYVAALPSGASDIVICTLSHSGGTDIALRLNGSTGNLSLAMSGGTGSPASVGTLAAGNRYLIELAHDSSGTQKIKGRINGGASSTEITLVTAANDLFGIELGNNAGTASTFDLYFDDLVVTDTYAFPGDLRVESLRPDITTSDLDTTWTITGGSSKRSEAVDEAPSDDSTTYIETSTATNVQRLELVTKTISGTIKALQPRGRTGSNGTTGTRTMTVNLRDGTAGTDGATASWSASINGWVVPGYPTPLLNVPGGSGWTQTNVDNAVLRFVHNGTAVPVRITQAYVLVAFEYSSSLTISGVTALVTWSSPASNPKVEHAGTAALETWTVPAANTLTTPGAHTTALATWSVVAPVVQAVASGVAALATWSVPAPVHIWIQQGVAALQTWTSPSPALQEIMAASAGLITFTSPPTTDPGAVVQATTALATWSSPSPTLAEIMAASAGLVTYTQPASTPLSAAPGTTALATWSVPAPTLAEIMAASSGVATWSVPAPTFSLAAQLSAAVVSWAQLAHTVVGGAGTAIVDMALLMWRRRRRF